jgi:ceramide glucosyltransferase
MPPIPLLIAAGCALLATAGTVYFALTIWSAMRFQHERKPAMNRAFTPPVSILKSLKGVDPHMYAALRSHCALDCPEYEVLFGVHELKEPALELVKKLQLEFPDRQLRVIVCPHVLGMNGKVSNLAQMLPQAAYEHIVINDSDIVVGPDYLHGVLAAFASPDIGMVTTLYRALPGKTLGSKLEALGISTDFAGGVLVARALEGGLRFGLGATIATTKTILREIGGLEPLADYLGDDYEIGSRVAAAGHRVELADTVVETALPDYSFRDFWRHQLRWARNVKDRRPSQYIGLIVTFGLPWAILGVMFWLSWWSCLVLAVATIARFASAILVGRGVLDDDQVGRDLWLLPARDFVALAVWVASFVGNTVEWRGMRFRLRKGKLDEIKPQRHRDTEDS